MLGGTIRGKQVTLRVPTEEDLASVNTWMADMRVRRGGHVWAEPAAPATWKERLKETAKDEFSVLWSLEAEGRCVGTIKIHYGWGAPFTENAIIRHFVLDPAVWGQGYGWDAALALHRYVFDYLHLRWSVVEMPADNAAGLRIAERLGFREYARGHRVYYRDGAYADQALLRMDLATWDERWSTEREYEPFPAEAEQ